MSRLRMIGAAAALFALVPAAAFADSLCDQPVEPAKVTVRDSGIDFSRSACSNKLWDVTSRALVAIDEPKFYGTLAAAVFLNYRTPTVAGVELEIGARLFDYRFVQNAVTKDTEVGAGPIWVGVAQTSKIAVAGKPAAWLWGLRFEVPGTELHSDVTKVVAAPYVVGTLALSPKWRLHGRAAALLWAGFPPGGVDTRAALAGSVDIGVHPVKPFAAVLGVEVQGGWRGGFDHALPRAALRYIGDDYEVEAGFSLPTLVGGDERTNASVVIGVRRRLGR